MYKEGVKSHAKRFSSKRYDHLLGCRGHSQGYEGYLLGCRGHSQGYEGYLLGCREHGRG